MISEGLTFLISRRQRILAVRVPVFPVPGPAMTAMERAGTAAARLCSGFRRSKNFSGLERSVPLPFSALSPPNFSPPFSFSPFFFSPFSSFPFFSSLSPAFMPLFSPASASLSLWGSCFRSFVFSGPAADSVKSPGPIMSNMLICPSVFSISSGSNRRMVPYSPSKPGSRVTLPSLSRLIPSAIRRPECF